MRRKLALRPDGDAERTASVIFGYELRDPSPSTHAVIEARSRAANEATRAAEKLVAATREVVRMLLVGNLAMSVRDVAKLLGLKKSFVHKIASECEGADGKERARLREAERETALETRRNAVPETITPASYRGEGLRARYRRRVESIANISPYRLRGKVSPLARPTRSSGRKR